MGFAVAQVMTAVFILGQGPWQETARKVGERDLLHQPGLGGLAHVPMSLRNACGSGSMVSA